MTATLRRASLYLPEASGAAIAAAMHVNAAGIYFEQEEPIAIEDWRNPERLVPALRSALEQFGPRERNLREMKKTDWPSYRVSRRGSVRQFEQSNFHIAVCATNEAESSYDASAKPRGESDLSLH